MEGRKPLFYWRIILENIFILNKVREVLAYTETTIDTLSNGGDELDAFILRAMGSLNNNHQRKYWFQLSKNGIDYVPTLLEDSPIEFIEYVVYTIAASYAIGQLKDQALHNAMLFHRSLAKRALDAMDIHERGKLADNIDGGSKWYSQ